MDSISNPDDNQISETLGVQSTLENCVCTLIQMLHDRKYTEIQTFPINKSQEPVIKAINTEHQVVWVFFTPQLNLAMLKEILKVIKDQKTKHQLVIGHIILVYQSNTHKALSTVTESDLVVEIFESNALQYNISQHFAQPITYRLNSEECYAQLLKTIQNHHKWKIEWEKAHHQGDQNTKKALLTKVMNKYPKILIDDPLCQYFKWSAGDMIKYTHRLGSTTTPFEEYLIVSYH